MANLSLGAPQLRVYFDGQGEPTADQLNTFEQTCDTFNDLRVFTGIQGLQVFTRGGLALADGLQGVFYWDPNSNLPDDNVRVIAVAGDTTGRWIRLTVPITYLAQPNTSAAVNDNVLITSPIITYFVDTSVKPITVTLPAQPGLNEVHVIKDVNGNAAGNPISLVGNGKLIDGQANIPSAVQVNFAWITLQYNGTSWSIIG